MKREQKSGNKPAQNPTFNAVLMGVGNLSLSSGVYLRNGNVRYSHPRFIPEMREEHLSAQHSQL